MQAEAMARALQRRGVPHRLLVFPAEGHGFRREATIRQALEVELAFYQEMLGL
jgi:dipeptidyl aminopeptidase/acylaminoacyl peptidase